MDDGRRDFLGRVAMTIAAAPLGLAATWQSNGQGPKGLAAVGAASEWLNSSRLTPSQLAGKTVLVNFCTYTCINWLRTLPYVRAWAKKYQQGLVVIGVHTPEFGFEHNVDNVRRAVQQLGIEHPVVMDNDYGIWRAFDNNAWPALYLLDGRGNVRLHHDGEGEYERTEAAIQRLLKEAGVGGFAEGVVSVDARGLEAPADWSNLKTPETYVGYERIAQFASPGGSDPDRRRPYAVPRTLALNQWALTGEWTIGRQATVLNSANGRIAYRFHARDVNLVMGPGRRSVRFRVSLDGQPPGAAGGIDVDTAGTGAVIEPRVYQLIRQAQPIVDQQVEIEFLESGVETFAFTFG